jgi:hypothetical protein
MHGFFQFTNVLAASDTALGWLVEFLDKQIVATATEGGR